MGTALTTIALPVALAIIMLGLGLGLTVADFARVAAHRRAVLVALACQLVLLPAVCFGLVLALDLPAVLAVGMLLLAASPGGTTANLFSHVFRGDVALNISLTAINSVLAVVTLPIVVNLALDYFLSAGDSVGLQFDKVLQVFAIVLVPVVVGMLVRQSRPDFADRMDRPVRIASVVVLVAVIAGTVVAERENIVGYFGSVGLAAGIFCLISLTVGYAAPRIARVGHRQALAVSMEIGIHNSTLAIAIAISPALLDSTEMAVPAAVYSVLMFVLAAAFGFLVTRRHRGADVADPAAPG